MQTRLSTVSEFDYDQGTPTPSVDNPFEYNIESTVTLPTVERQGYVFAGWEVAVEGVGNWESTISSDITSISGKYGNVTLTAEWINSTDTPYQVQYWKQNITGDGYDVTTQNKAGTTLEEADDYNEVPDTGFDHLATEFYKGSIAEANKIDRNLILESGDLIVVVKFERVTRTVTLTKGANVTNFTLEVTEGQGKLLLPGLQGHRFLPCRLYPDRAAGGRRTTSNGSACDLA